MVDRLPLTFIIIGAALWGTIGVFVQKLYDFGLSPLQVVTVRVVTAAFLLIVYLLIKNRKALYIKKNDIKYFIGTGIFSIVFFNWCFFKAIQETSLSIAAILLYTGPAFVTILSRILFKELLTTRKILALFATSVGCIFVIGLFPLHQSSINTLGIIVGLGSGLGYALYSIFSKYALVKYSSETVTVYTFIVASIALIPTSKLWEVDLLFTSLPLLGYALGLGFGPTVLAYLLYTKGLEKVETSRASISSTIEPVVAAFIGVFMFGDLLTIWQFIGIFIVLAAVILVQEKEQHKGATQQHIA